MRVIIREHNRDNQFVEDNLDAITIEPTKTQWRKNIRIHSAKKNHALMECEIHFRPREKSLFLHILHAIVIQVLA
jgi:hypothetical protein